MNGNYCSKVKITVEQKRDHLATGECINLHGHEIISRTTLNDEFRR